jgi:hypothetical protein
LQKDLENRNILLIFVLSNKKEITMRKNLFVLLVLIMFSAFTSAFGGMPTTWNQFFAGFGISFVFWFCMFAPAFLTEEEK